MKPCPFCGEQVDSRLILHEGSKSVRFQCGCLICGAQGPWSDNEEGAKKAWNVRHGSIEPALSFVKDMSEHDCTYGDNCPKFGSRHGQCVGCKAREVLEKIENPTPNTHLEKAKELLTAVRPHFKALTIRLNDGGRRDILGEIDALLKKL